MNQSHSLDLMRERAIKRLVVDANHAAQRTASGFARTILRASEASLDAVKVKRVVDADVRNAALQRRVAARLARSTRTASTS